MLLPSSLHDGIPSGEVTLAFRSWKRPSIKAGDTLQTPAGLLRIDALEQIAAAEITDDDARTADVASSMRPATMESSSWSAMYWLGR